MVYKALKKDAVRHFTSVRDPASFSSASKLRKHYFKKTALRHVEDELQSVDAYTKHKPYKRRFPRRKTQTWGIDKQWQLDLIEMLPFKKYNKGYSYIMVAIDVFSRYAFAEAIKSKEGKSVTKAFKTMIKERCPLYVQTDKGKEFLNKHFKDLMKERGITFFTGENSDIKCSLAERFNSTLQSKMWRYFTHANTYTYIDVLQDLVHSYNNTFHDTLRGRPVDVNRDNADRLFYHLYEGVSPEDLKRKEKQEEEVPIKKGQKARILRTKKTFNRGYEPNWTEEIFTVKNPDYVRGYELEDALREPIKGWFYRQQVQKVKVSPRKRYTVEKILKYRGKGSKREALIKWKGYGDKFNSWEPVKNIGKWI